MYVEHLAAGHPGDPHPHRRPLASPHGGPEVVIRSLGPDDGHLVRELLLKASARTLFQRFHAPLARVPDRVVQTLIRAQPGRQEAVVALLGAGPVGHAQWARVDEDHARRAEIAALVIDAHQGAGIGRRLIEEVAERAWRAGIREAVLHVRPESRRIRDALLRRGAVLDVDSYVLPLRALRRSTLVRWSDAVPSPRTPDGHLTRRD